jgi:hypothetical protein
MQAYALTRPAVRFRLHVLKAKNNKGDFIYAPKVTSNVKDAVLKVIGKDCALQCDWTTLESGGFEIHAFLPKPTANGAKIANHGAFISVDSRPVSNSRGTIKQLVAALKERLRKSNSSLTTVKDPFFCMNIICPPDSYDPNIEPAKDDVMFDDGGIVLSAVKKLLKSYYPEAVVDMDQSEPPTSAQQQEVFQEEQLQMQSPTPISVHEDSLEEPAEDQTPGRSSNPRWRSSMYGIDEDDLEFLQENHPQIIEEEEGARSVAVSNPWTIARMNALVKTVITNGQLMSPAKSQHEKSVPPSSPALLKTPIRKTQIEPLTPQTSSKMNESGAALDEGLQQSMQRLSSHALENYPEDNLSEHASRTYNRKFSSSTRPEFIYSGQSGLQEALSEASGLAHSSLSASPMRARDLPSQKPPPLCSQRKEPFRSDELIDASAQAQHDTLLGQPMRGSQPWRTPRRQKRNKARGVPLFGDGFPSSPQRSDLTAADKLMEPRLHSDNNTDIRDFFGQNRRNHAREASEPSTRPSFTSISAPYQSSLQQTEARQLKLDEPVLHNRSSSERARPSSQPLSSKITSFDRMYEESNTSRQSQAIEAPSRTHEPHVTHPQHSRPSSVDSLYASAPVTRDPRHSTNAYKMVAYFKAYQDRTSTSPTHSRTPPAHKTARNSCPKSHRTTKTLHRLKSFKLPLERVLYGSHLQNHVLSLQTSVTSIVQCAWKLDMRANSLEWGYVADDAGDWFAEPVLEERVVIWVGRLDEMMHGRWEGMGGVDAKRMMLEGIWRGLSGRKEKEEVRAVEVVEGCGWTGEADVVVVNESGVKVAQIGLQTTTQTEDEVAEIDKTQYVDFNAVNVDVKVPGPAAVDPAEDEFRDDIEDNDMLMDT